MTHGISTVWLLSGVAGLVTAMAAPAFAQEAAPASTTQMATSRAGEAPEVSDKALPTIVVTASRRTIDVQKESRPVTALSAAQLERAGVSDVSSLQNLVPGLNIARSGGYLQYFIRGVGDRTSTGFSDSGVAVSLDGVFLPRSFTGAQMMFDMQRVEVLKGPQGTLYGRNANAGAINLDTNQPGSMLGGYLNVDGGITARSRPRAR